MTAEGPLPTSLALYRESVASDGPLSRCPRKLEYVMFQPSTGLIAPARCVANACPFCGPMNARLVAGAIALAEPTRSILVTNAGRDWSTIRNRMKQLTHRIRREGYRHEMAWHVEPNPSGSGEHHAHCWQRGDFIPQADLAEFCSSVGFGEIATISAIRKRGRALGYGLKLTGISYGLKLTEAEDQMGTYLRANGGRLVHATRDFWRDDNGAKCGQREAMRAWAKQRGDTAATDDETWQFVRAAHLVG